MSTERAWRGRSGDGSMQAQAKLWLAGASALALGVLVYLTDRQVSHGLLPQFGSFAGHRWFGAVGGWLPSFTHVLAFSLFSAALLQPRPRWQYGACIFWLTINALFEVGQHPQVRDSLVDALQRSIGHGPAARAIENYFLRGTFDRGDVAAAALGAVAAALLLRRVRLESQTDHDPASLAS